MPVPPAEEPVEARPLYLLIEDHRHQFLARECVRRRIPGRAPLAKSVVVREALQVYQEIVECAVGDDDPGPETVQRLVEIARRCQKPIRHTRIRFDHSKEVELIDHARE